MRLHIIIDSPGLTAYYWQKTAGQRLHGVDVWYFGFWGAGGQGGRSRGGALFFRSDTGERAGGVLCVVRASCIAVVRATAICRCNFVVKGFGYREYQQRRDHHRHDDDDLTDGQKYQI